MFTAHVVALADDPAMVLAAPAVSVFADAVAAVIVAVMAVRVRFPMLIAPVWQTASAVSRGLLLAPSWPLSAR